MFKFIIDIFCKDTIIGLSDFADIRPNRIYKNKYNNLFSLKRKNKVRFINPFTDPIACRL